MERRFAGSFWALSVLSVRTRVKSTRGIRGNRGRTSVLLFDACSDAALRAARP